MPVTHLQAFVPDRFTVYEFPPGVGYVHLLSTSCSSASLDNSSALAESRQVVLAIALSGLDRFVLDWIVSDATLADALTSKGFVVTMGDLVPASPPAGLPYLEATVRSESEKATLRWIAAEESNGEPDEFHLVQDVGGATPDALVRQTGLFRGGLMDACIVSLTDPLWESVFAAPNRDCQPFVLQSDLTYEIAEPAVA